MLRSPRSEVATPLHRGRSLSQCALRRSLIVVACGALAFALSPATLSAQTPEFEFDAIDTTIGYDFSTGEGSGDVSVFNSQISGGVDLVQGWYLGLAHDPTFLTAISVEQGEYIQSLCDGDGPVFFEVSITPDGITISCLYCFGPFCCSCTYEVAKEIAVVTYQTQPGLLAGDSDGEAAALTFDDTLGSFQVPNSVVVGGPAIPVIPNDAIVTLTPIFPIARGDANGDGVLDPIPDAIASLDYLFLAGSTVPCLDALDGNDDGVLDLADPLRLLNWGFIGGPPPPPPFPICGTDPTPDDLPCETNGCP